ncbi:MAG: hypothetical protein OXN97_18260 [Bryobacterales bacterium]|nr:hypothetical protein [Bryobacterales bacterium]
MRLFRPRGSRRAWMRDIGEANRPRESRAAVRMRATSEGFCLRRSPGPARGRDPIGHYPQVPGIARKCRSEKGHEIQEKRFSVTGRAARQRIERRVGSARPLGRPAERR